MSIVSTKERDEEGKRTFPVVGSKIAGSIPKKGTVAEPGLVSIAPGKGVTTIEPVSVCLSYPSIHQHFNFLWDIEHKTHQNVSTIAHS